MQNGDFTGKPPFVCRHPGACPGACPGESREKPGRPRYSTVTLFARFRGWSTLQPRSTAMWYASSCSGTLARMGVSASCVRQDGDHVTAWAHFQDAIQLLRDLLVLRRSEPTREEKSRD